MKSRSFIFIILAALFISVGCKKEITASKNTNNLMALIDSAKSVTNGVTEGYEPGTYPVGSVSNLQQIIDSAQTLAKISTTQFGIDLAEIMLKQALTNFMSSVQQAKELYFDGSGYMDGGSASDYNRPNHTIEAWIYVTEFKSGAYIISTEGANTGYRLTCPNGKPTYTIGTGTTGISIAATANVALNKWTHVAGTFNGTVMKLYVGGVMAIQRNLTGSIINNTQNFRIGEGSQFTGRTFKGRIKDVRIWDHALTDAEITASMTDKPVGTETGLVAYWPFNLSAGTRIYDRTGKKYVDLINVQYVDPI